MKSIYIIVLIGTILFIVFLLPITISEPYNTIETYEENYTVTEPRDVQVADWAKENIVVSQPFEDTRYNQQDLKYEISSLMCLNYLQYGSINLAIPEWGKISVISYEDNKYFAGYKKGFFTKRKDIYTFDKKSLEGHIYKIIRNENVNITLKQGEYLTLAEGYSVQVNSIGDDLKSSKTTCSGGYSGGHYVPEDGENGDTGTCTTTTEHYQGALLSLSDLNIIEKWNVKNGSTLIYQRTLSGGETLPMIVIHINNVTNSTINVDAIFQISKDHVNTPSGLGAEIAVGITNTDLQSGTFSVYTGFILNSTLGTEIGRLNQVFLNPSESATLFYTTNKDTEDCRYYVRSISKASIPENFTNFRDVNLTKRNTEYRNVTLYVDVTKKRLAERNVTKHRSKTIYGLFNFINN